MTIFISIIFGFLSFFCFKRRKEIKRIAEEAVLERERFLQEEELKRREIEEEEKLYLENITLLTQKLKLGYRIKQVDTIIFPYESDYEDKIKEYGKFIESVHHSSAPIAPIYKISGTFIYCSSGKKECSFICARLPETSAEIKNIIEIIKFIED